VYCHSLARPASDSLTHQHVGVQVVDFSLASWSASDKTFHKQDGLQVIALNTSFREASAVQLSTLLLKKRTPSRSSEK